MKLGVPPREMLRGGHCLFCLLAPSRSRAGSRFAGPCLPNASRPLASVGKLVECGAIWLGDFKQTDEASILCSARPDFKRTLYGSPIPCDLHSTTITGLLPAAANAFRRSSNIVCDP